MFCRSSCSHEFFQGIYRTDNFRQQLLIKKGYVFGRPILCIRFFKGSLLISPLLLPPSDPWSSVFVFVTVRMALIHSLNGTIFIFTGELAVIRCLSNSFSSRYCNYFLEYSQVSILLTVLCIFLMLKLANALSFSVIQAPVPVKQIYYQNSYISRAELIIMKWAIFAERFFQNT